MRAGAQQGMVRALRGHDAEGAQPLEDLSRDADRTLGRGGDGDAKRVAEHCRGEHLAQALARPRRLRRRRRPGRRGRAILEHRGHGERGRRRPAREPPRRRGGAPLEPRHRRTLPRRASQAAPTGAAAGRGIDVSRAGGTARCGECTGWMASQQANHRLKPSARCRAGAPVAGAGGCLRGVGLLARRRRGGGRDELMRRGAHGARRRDVRRRQGARVAPRIP
jgi:hypothetical protein